METNNTLIRLHCGNNKDLGQLRVIHDDDMYGNVSKKLQQWAHLMSNMTKLIENHKLVQSVDLTFFKLVSNLTSGSKSTSYYVVFQAADLHNNTLGIFEITPDMKPILYMANRYDDTKLFAKGKVFFIDTQEPQQFFLETKVMYDMSEEKVAAILERHMLIWQCINYEKIIFDSNEGGKL